MGAKTDSLLQVRPGIAAPLDPGFSPAVLANRRYREVVGSAGDTGRLGVAVERENGFTYRRDLDVLTPATSAYDEDTRCFVERHIKFALWSRGGWKLSLSGPESICRSIQAVYGADGPRAFDADLMKRVYDRPFEIEVVAEKDMPEPKEASAVIGGHLDGCRIGFDLGASDYKLAAVVDGEPVFSKEIAWQPVVQEDPAYHYERIVAGLKEAASHLPRVDAIGGSAAGIYVNNEVKVASLFRGVPEAEFEKSAKPMFLNIQKEFDVPLVVANDGDVTALAGAMSLKRNAMLGVAMGSSEAAGYLDPRGCITGILNELAFGPVDFNPEAAVEDWSGDKGVGALYFSQQAVSKLAPAAGMTFPEEMALPERLKQVQEKADKGDASALAIFETIGVYLGYSLPHYADYYDYENVLILGRVTSGTGGETLLRKAKDVLQGEFPEMAEKVTVHVPDEKSRRVGQAVAAASLPKLR